MLTIRSITDAEIPAFRESLMLTFGEDADDVDPHGEARMRALIPPSQLWAAFDDGAVVATAGTFDHAIGLPGGGTLPVAGLTMVTVRPTHRRRGILRELMRLHLAGARDRGYAASALWASEAGIYGRFGYGLASESDALEIHHAATVRFSDSWPDSAYDAVEAIDEARARELLPAIYARATAARPGALRRGDVWWRERRFLESPWARSGASRRRHVVARRGDDLVGFVQYRQRPAFANGLPSGKVEIVELHAIDTRAEATLWRFVMSVDLFPTVTWWCAPVDCPLPWLLGDGRRVQRSRADNLWLRVEDIATAIAARGYTSDGQLRMAVDDTTWDVTVAGGTARGEPTSAPAQIAMSRATFGAMYLGGSSASRLARAGLVQGDDRSLATADHLFASQVAPWCPEVF